MKQVCNPQHRFSNTPSKQGVEHEMEAGEAYIQSRSQAEQCGFVIHTPVSGNPVSPDELRTCDCCVKASIEIRCPLKSRTDFVQFSICKFTVYHFKMCTFH